MSWWSKVQRSMSLRDPNSLKKTVLRSADKYNQQAKKSSEKLQGRLTEQGTQLSKQASDYGNRATSELKKTTDEYGSRAMDKMKRTASANGAWFQNIPERLRLRSIELGREAQKRVADRIADMQQRAVGAAKALPAKAIEMGKDAAAAGGRAAKTAAETGTRAAIDAGKRATGKASDAMPGVKSYATWAGRKVVYVLFGTAFLYGLGSALPGAVAKYYGEGTGRRRESDDNKEEDQIVVAKYR